MKKWPMCLCALAGIMVTSLTLGQGYRLAEAAGADMMMLTGGLDNLFPAVQIEGGSPSTYQLAASCVTTVPSFVDADVPPSGEATTGTCGSLGGPGTYTNVVCGTGLAQGSATLYEPGGEQVAVGPYVIAMVSGVGAVAVLGYGDDGAWGGGGSGIALITPEPLTGCGSLTTFSLALALSVAHN